MSRMTGQCIPTAAECGGLSFWGPPRASHTEPVSESLCPWRVIPFFTPILSPPARTSPQTSVLGSVVFIHPFSPRARIRILPDISRAIAFPQCGVLRFYSFFYLDICAFSTPVSRIPIGVAFSSSAVSCRRSACICAALPTPPFLTPTMFAPSSAV